MIKRTLVPFLLAVLLCAAAASAHAENDVVHFGANINVSSEATIHDAVCFFCSVNVEGKVNGDVVVFFGHVHLAGSADHDVVSFFGGIRADDGASVGQDLVNFFGSVTLGDNVSVGQDLVVLLGSAHLADSVKVGQDSVIQPGWMIDAPLILVLILMIVIAMEYRAFRRRRYWSQFPYPPPHP
jgi:hypothetical protein